MFIHTFLLLIIGTKMCIENQNRKEVKETTFNIQSKAILLRHILTKIMTSPDCEKQMVHLVKN